MKITILGATGMVGKKLLSLALEQEHHITILVRSLDKLPPLPSNVKVIIGDYFDSDSLSRAITDSDAVLSTIGPPTQRNTNVKPEAYGEAMKQLVHEMDKGGIKRFVNLASTGTRLPKESVNWKRMLLIKLLSFVAPVVIPAKEQELLALVNSKLEWTSIRPPLITDNVSGHLCVNESSTQGWRVDTTQLCILMLEQLDSSQWINSAPFVGTR